MYLPNIQSAVPITNLSSYERASEVFVQSATLAVGNNDLYTVPAGKKAIPIFTQVANLTAGNITAYGMLKRSATYYRVTANQTVNANQANLNCFMNNFVYEPGDTIAINATAVNLRAVLRILLVPSNHPLRTVTMFNLALGDNSFYTVPPTVKKAYILPASQSATQNLFSPGYVYYSNSSGAAVTCGVFFMPNGQVKGSTFQQYSVSIANLLVNGFSLPNYVTTGDFVVINLSSGTAGSHAFMTVYEQ